jgi:hypothetical protein
MPDGRIEVKSYSGYRGEEVPRSFIFRGEKIEITEIIAQWIEEGIRDRTRKRFFKMKGSDGSTYDIYSDEKTEEWFVL